MKVKELIEKLSNIDPEREVLFPGYEGGYTNLNNIEPDVLMALYVNKAWYYGEHERCKDNEYKDFEKASCVIVH